jgi:hypothetical protein
VKVSFTKTGARRYGITVEREHWPDLVGNPAAGYDDWLPHDLLHFVAEAEWRMDGAVFGPLAAGRDSGGFYPADPALVRAYIRKRHKRPKGKPKGRRSELLADILEDGWNIRRGRAALPANWDERLEAARVTPTRLENVLDGVDDLAEQWHALHVGEPLTLDWPRPERKPH